MAKNQMSGVIPLGIGNLVHLEDLDFTRNHRHGVIPEDIGRLQNLIFFILWGSPIRRLCGSIPQELSKIYGLQKLYLAHNNLSGAIPQLLQNSSALVELDLL
ncbi:hypothetical protein BDA96_09G040100 [Sorghum bicolor]|uniref:Leucine-rich repeat-containing N-terminal plant-type domain-containing protein n=1 Tax=Sorghum bicolor TaxID=4558 RepID=A0A921Q797_SORBI|nr:hypothetical protein BDA96_09G040100 [Sorghum bicolor]